MLKKELPEGWRLVKLEEVAKIDNKAVSPDEMRGELQNYIGLENIESNTGQLVSFSETLGDDIKSNKFGFTEEHILYGKLRPYLNKVYLPDFAGVCSTDIIPIKPDSDLLIREFLGYFLRTPEFVSMINAKSSGANLPRVNPKTLLDVYIPLPPIETQYKIVAILEKTEATQRLRAEADALTQKLMQNVFLEMFGDPATNPKGWDIVKLDAIAVLQRGKFSHRPRNEPRFYGGSYPFIQTGDISRSGGRLTTFSQTLNDEGLKISKLFKKGIIVIAIAANIGDTAILDFDSCFPDSVVGVSPMPDKANPIFTEMMLRHYKNILWDSAPETAQRNINLKILSDLNVILPPLDLQNRFAKIAQSIQVTRDIQNKSAVEKSSLLNNLMSKAFTGELVA
ncbi:MULTISPECIES: restriction endonuclease subunit S [Methanoculleus]|uniref:Restriction modification system DNA specificity domain n=2 Tax=Methanoculleus TaxID=45989 RepID=A3CUH6_METMJ|nr:MULTISPECIES: restriction endonuclease subunit S [Methanoculleus]ABN57026.1 restriction modification system DNA specificity domain [Methanoculleus marisnigri JR1]UYU18445.1 restriction endonuclease subunit S [Methanoculleus submarinus]